MTERGVRLAQEAKDKKEAKHQRNVEAATNFAKKNSEV
jgi:hypothetical protein